jgi:hypothetical protein
MELNGDRWLEGIPDDANFLSAYPAGQRPPIPFNESP